MARFQQPGPPAPDQLLVCSLVGEGEFWCVDYELFREHVRADAARKPENL